MYSYKVDDQSPDHNSLTPYTYEVKKFKGQPKRTVARELKYEDYSRCLEGDDMGTLQSRSIRSYNHQIYTIEQNKKSLCRYDDKRYILDDGFRSLAHGHYKIPMNERE